MSWSKFRFHCRFISKQIASGIRRDTALSNIKNSEAVYLYEKGQQSKVKQFMFDKILSIERDDELIKVANVYGEIDFNSVSFDPLLRKKYDNFETYLACLLIGYFLIGALYRNFVYPEFISVFQEFGVQTNNMMIDYDFIWVGGLLILVPMLLLTILLNRYIRRFDEFLIVPSQSKWLHYVLPRKLKSQMRLINDILMSPFREEDNKVTTTLRWIERNGLHVPDELNGLIIDKKIELEDYIEKKMSMLTVVVFSVLVFFIYQLLVVMYEPIFRMGEIV